MSHLCPKIFNKIWQKNFTLGQCQTRHARNRNIKNLPVLPQLGDQIKCEDRKQYNGGLICFFHPKQFSIKLMPRTSLLLKTNTLCIYIYISLISSWNWTKLCKNQNLWNLVKEIIIFSFIKWYSISLIFQVSLQLGTKDEIEAPTTVQTQDQSKVRRFPRCFRRLCCASGGARSQEWWHAVPKPLPRRCTDFSCIII
jgi:hypothetical protein